jgi:hypothetical protein
MGAGSSKQNQYNIQYTGLHRIQRELEAQGILSEYKNKALYGFKPNGDTFFITYSLSSAPNGEGIMWPRAQVQIAGVFTDYDKPEWWMGPSYHKEGKAAILAHFAA